MWPTFYIPGLARGVSGPVCTVETQYSNEVLYPWATSEVDPRDPRNLHTYGYYDGIENLFTTLADACAFAATDRGYTSVDEHVYGWAAVSDQATGVGTAPYFTETPGENLSVVLRLNRAEHPVNAAFKAVGSYCTVTPAILANDTLEWSHGGIGTGGSGGASYHGLYYRDVAGAGAPTLAGAGPENSFCSPPIYIYYDVPIRAYREPQAPYDECLVPGESARPLWDQDPAYCVLGSGNYQEIKSWTLVEGVNVARALQKYEFNAMVSPQVVTKYPLNPIRPTGHADDNQTFWEAAYAQAVADGKMPSGLTYGTDYPVYQQFYYTRTLTICVPTS